jgi:hypothetical protein
MSKTYHAAARLSTHLCSDLLAIRVVQHHVLDPASMIAAGHHLCSVAPCGRPPCSDKYVALIDDVILQNSNWAIPDTQGGCDTAGRLRGTTLQDPDGFHGAVGSTLVNRTAQITTFVTIVSRSEIEEGAPDLETPSTVRSARFPSERSSVSPPTALSRPRRC